MSDEAPTDRRRRIPAVHVLADDPALAALVASRSRPVVVQAARRVLERARAALQAGGEPDFTPAAVARELDADFAPRLRRVLNATGIVLHTNLGRAPLAEAARARVAEAAGATNLELDLVTGRRGGRDEAIQRHLGALVGAERAFAVNNGAAATLLALAATAAGREVLVSRGELVEIGGGFRVPEVIVQGGCRLVEVGTTNRTRTSDYLGAAGPNTGAILKVHRSNFALVGFVEEVPIAELSAVARRLGVPLVYDQGTGDPAEVRAALEDGADLVLFSGDKLLGGPQAGLVAGRAEAVERARRHPLARALRADKLCLAALEATLAIWRSGALEQIPVQRRLAEPVETVQRRARRLAEAIGAPAVAGPTEAAAGGGTRPGEVLPSWGVRLALAGASGLARALRTGDQAVVGSVRAGALWLDARTLDDDEVDVVAAAVRRALGAGGLDAGDGPDGEEADAGFEGRE